VKLGELSDYNTNYQLPDYQITNYQFCMRILLIGGNGFIGPFVRADLERRGHEVFVLHRPRTHACPRRAKSSSIDALADSANELRALAPDVVVDLISAPDARRASWWTCSRARPASSR
jgi:nucleoside-diphosphate-sugar epimerase